MAISEKQRDFFAKQQQKINKTAYIRFNVAEKLTKSEKLSTAFSAMLTVYLICSSIVLFADGGFSSTLEGRAVSLIGIISSISLLVVNLMDGAMGRPLIANAMHQNAQSILKLSSLIEVELRSDQPDSELLKEHLVKYHDSLERVGTNHDSWDNRYYEILEGVQSPSKYLSLLSWVNFQKLRSVNFVVGWWFHLIIFAICFLGFLLLARYGISFFEALS